MWRRKTNNQFSLFSIFYMSHLENEQRTVNADLLSYRIIKWFWVTDVVVK